MPVHSRTNVVYHYKVTNTFNIERIGMSFTVTTMLSFLFGLFGGMTVSADLYNTNIMTICENYASAQQIQPADTIQMVSTLGYYTVGDGGGTCYRRVSSDDEYQLVCANNSYWQIAETELSPLMFGAHPDREDTADDSAAIQETFRCAAQMGRSVYVPSGYYYLASTITVQPKPIPDPDYRYLKSGTLFRFDKMAFFIATEPMAAIMTFGDDRWETIFRNGSMMGGVFDCNDLAQSGVWVKLFNTFRIQDVEVRDFLHYGFRMGSSNAPARSYEALFDACLTKRSAVSAPENSVGIYFENAGDSHVLNSVICGAAIGISGDDVWDSKFTNVHVWNTVEHGEVLYGFDVDGDNALVGCQVDGPFRYAYRFKKKRNSLSACNVNWGLYGAQDNAGTIIKIEDAGGVTAMNCNWKTAIADQVSKEVEGNKSDFVSIGNKYQNVPSYAICHGPAEPSLSGCFTVLNQEVSISDKSINVLSANRLSPGVYEITSENPISESGPLLITPQVVNSSSPLIGVENISNRSSNKVQITFFSLTGVQDPSGFSLLMIGAGDE